MCWNERALRNDTFEQLRFRSCWIGCFEIRRRRNPETIGGKILLPKQRTPVLFLDRAFLVFLIRNGLSGSELRFAITKMGFGGVDQRSSGSRTRMLFSERFEVGQSLRVELRPPGSQGEASFDAIVCNCDWFRCGVKFQTDLETDYNLTH